MRKRTIKNSNPEPGDPDYDPFLRRIQLQGMVIRKMLSEAEDLTMPVVGQTPHNCIDEHTVDHTLPDEPEE